MPVIGAEHRCRAWVQSIGAEHRCSLHVYYTPLLAEDPRVLYSILYTRPRTRSITMLAVEIAALPLAAISTISPQFSEEQKHAWRHTLTRKNLVGGPTFVALPIHPPAVNLTMPSGVSTAPSACTSAAPPEPLGSPRSRQQVSSSLSAVRETMAESSSENLGQSSSV